MTTARPAARRRGLRPGQGKLLGATAMLVAGAFLPWIYTPAGPVIGIRGPGLWTLYASMLALASALIPHRTLAVVQACLCAVVAIVLPVWQMLHVLGMVGTGGWLPGPGAVMSAGAGVLCLAAARQLLTRE